MTVTIVIIGVSAAIAILASYEQFQKRGYGAGCFLTLVVGFTFLLTLCGFLIGEYTNLAPRIFTWTPRLVAPVLTIIALAARMRRPRPGIEALKLDPDVPEIVAATSQAGATLGYFIQQLEKHPGRASVRFPRVIGGNFKEHVWACVCAYEPGLFRVSLATPYLKDMPFTEMEVTETDVEDWLILFPDNTIKGAFSYIAGFRYLERKGKKLNKTMRKQKEALLDFGRPV